MPQSEPKSHRGLTAIEEPPQEPPDPASSHNTCFAAVALLLVWLTTLLVMRSV